MNKLHPYNTLLVRIFTDTWSHKGRPLLLSLLHHYSANGYAIRYFKYDSLLHGEELGVHNFSTYKKLPVITNSKVTTEDILQEWKNGVKDGDKVIVAVDSLSPLIVNHKIGALCKAITRLCQLSMFFELIKTNFNLTILMDNFQKTFI